MKRRVRASTQTRKQLEDFFSGRSGGESGQSELVKLATQLLIEEMVLLPQEPVPHTPALPIDRLKRMRKAILSGELQYHGFALRRWRARLTIGWVGALRPPKRFGRPRWLGAQPPSRTRAHLGARAAATRRSAPLRGPHIEAMGRGTSATEEAQR